MTPATPVGLPSTTVERPRPYVVSGFLGLLCFVASGVWWDRHPFVGQLFMELGGGAFIVFLLEVLLPSALGYAASVRRVLRVTALVWSSTAVRTLLVDCDDEERAWLLDAIRKGPYPARRSVLGRVRSTADRHDGRRVLARSVGVGAATVRYCVLDRGLRTRRVMITGVRRPVDG